MQGALRKQSLSATVQTTCAYTGRVLTLDVDSEARSTVREQGANPFFSVPLVELRKLKDPSIIDRF